MSYFEQFKDDPVSQDAFGRKRVSGTGQRLDVEFLYDKQIEYFDEQLNNGTATHNGNPRDVTLALSDGNNGSYAKLSSYPVPYTPGNGGLVEITGILDLAAIGSGTAEVFLRSNISGTPTDLNTNVQSTWSSQSSGVDWTDSHIFAIDFQSLKVGRIRFAMVVDGETQVVSTIENDNLRNSGYWQMANLPVYYHLYTDSGTTYMEIGYGDANNAVGFRYYFAANASATMKAICCTVKSEGGPDLLDMPGIPRCTDMGETVKTVSNSVVPLISIRPKSTFQSFPNLVLSIPTYMTVQTDNPIRLIGLIGTTLSAGTTTFSDVDTNNSVMEVNTGATAYTGGREIMVEYISSNGKNTSGGDKALLGKTVMWDRQDDTETGIFTLAAIRTTATDADVLVSINWEEIK